MHAPALVEARILRFERAGGGGQLLLGSGDGDAGRQSRRDAHEAAARAIVDGRIEPRRGQQIRILTQRGEARGQHPDHYGIESIELQVPAQDARVTTEAGLPKPMT